MQFKEFTYPPFNMYLVLLTLVVMVRNECLKTDTLRFLSAAHLICGCNPILNLGNQLTRLGFHAFVLPLFEGGVSSLCVFNALFAKVIVQPVSFPL